MLMCFEKFCLHNGIGRTGHSQAISQLTVKHIKYGLL